MAISILKQGQDLSISYLELYADTEEDIKNLPTSKTKGINGMATVLPYSQCTVVETSNIYILNSEDVWVKQN